MYLFDIAVESRGRSPYRSRVRGRVSASISFMVHALMVAAAVRLAGLVSSAPVGGKPAKTAVVFEMPAGLVNLPSVRLRGATRRPSRQREEDIAAPSEPRPEPSVDIMEKPLVKPAFPVGTPLPLPAADRGRVVVGLLDGESGQQPVGAGGKRGSVVTGQIYGNVAEGPNHRSRELFPRRQGHRSQRQRSGEKSRRDHVLAAASAAPTRCMVQAVGLGAEWEPAGEFRSGPSPACQM